MSYTTLVTHSHTLSHHTRVKVNHFCAIAYSSLTLDRSQGLTIQEVQQDTVMILEEDAPFFNIVKK